MARILRLVFGVGLLWGLFPVMMGRHWLGLDLLRMDMGGMCEWRHLFSSGQPLWIAPHLGLGAPFAVDPLQGVFYPVKWLYFWLPGFLATDVHVAVHFAVAAAGASFLARSFGVGRIPCFFLGLAYLFSGTLLDLARHSPYLVGGAWLPWAWACARFGLRRPTFQRGLGLCLSLGLMLLGGDAFAWIWGFAIVILECLDDLVRRRSFARVVSVFLSAVSGTVLGAFLWLPAWIEMALSGRQGGISLESALQWSWSLRDLPGVVLSGIFKRGSLLGGSIWSLLHRSGAQVPWNESPFLGFTAIIGLFGSSVSWFRSSRMRRRLGVAPVILVLSFLLALGDGFFLSEWLYRSFPALTNLRYPSKHWVVLNLATILVAGIWIQAKARGVGSLRLVQSLFVVIAVLLIFLVLTREFWLERSKALALAQGWSWNDQAPTAFEVLALSGIPVVFAGALGWTLHRFSRSWILVILAAELFAGAGLSVEWLSPEQSALQVFSPLVEVAQDYRQETGTEAIFCLSPEVEQLGLTQKGPGGTEDLASLILYQRLAALPQLNACDGVTLAHGYSIMRQSTQRRLHLNFEALSGAARALGCTHVLKQSQETGLAAGARELLPGITQGLQGRLVVVRVQDPVPKYFSLERAVPILDDWNYMGLSRTEVSSSTLLTHVSGIQEPLSLAALNVQGIEVNPAHYILRIKPRESDDSRLKTGIVGVRTSYARGWRAYQNGRRLSMVAAAGIFLSAVIDDPGAGEVEFIYTPPWEP